uniref:histone H1-like n=1 Tax=Semicossyphus pulcher TaxID=241346 RepID=UPI0037E86864
MDQCQRIYLRSFGPASGVSAPRHSSGKSPSDAFDTKRGGKSPRGVPGDGVSRTFRQTQLSSLTCTPAHLQTRSAEHRDKEMGDDKKKATLGKRKTGPNLTKLVTDSLAGCNSRKGLSVIGIKNYLKSKGVDTYKCNKRINNTVIRLKNRDFLVQVTGRGASGSFKLAKREREPKPRPAAKRNTTKRPAAKRPTAKKLAAKRPAAKRAAAKKPATKKGAKTTTKKGPVKKTAQTTPGKKAAGKTTPRKPKVATKNRTRKIPMKTATKQGKARTTAAKKK